MGWMNNVFGGGMDNPAKGAQPYLDKMPGYADQYMQPLINQGNTAGGIAQQQYAAMAQDPSQFYNNMFKNYGQSDYSKFMSDQLGRTNSATAAQGGFSGTSGDINKQMETQNALLSQDWNQYFDQVSGLQNQGLQGEMSMYGTGANAASQAYGGMNQYAQLSAQNQFAGTQAQNASAGGMFGNIAGAVGLGAGLYGASGGLGDISGWFGGGGSGGGVGDSMGNAGNMAAMAAMFI